MNTWNGVDEGLPSVDEIVEVWVAFGQGKSALQSARPEVEQSQKRA